eukprot:tig00020830_g14446.t1
MQLLASLPAASVLYHAVVARLTYFRIHLLIWVSATLIGGAILCAMEAGKDFAYTDGLFQIASAITCTGLTSVDFAKLNRVSQVFIWIMVFLGGAVVEVYVVLVLRRRAFRKRGRLMPFLRAFVQGEAQMPEPCAPTRPPAPPRLAARSVSPLSDSLAPPALESRSHPLFIDLIEYSALGKLQTIVGWYLVTFLTVPVFILSMYANLYSSVRERLEGQGISPTWFGFFHGPTAFFNAGFTLMADNLIQFQTDRLVLLMVSLCIIAGNTAFPVILHWAVSLCYKYSHDKVPYYYLLTHPRHCTTHLFPRAQTNFLLLLLLATNVSQMVFFLALDYNRPVFETMSAAERFLAAFFQSVSTRTAGFNVVDLSLLSPAMWIVDLHMMYLSAYPFIISLRHSGAQRDILEAKELKEIEGSGSEGGEEEEEGDGGGPGWSEEEGSAGAGVHEIDEADIDLELGPRTGERPQRRRRRRRRRRAERPGEHHRQQRLVSEEEPPHALSDEERGLAKADPARDVVTVYHKPPGVQRTNSMRAIIFNKAASAAQAIAHPQARQSAPRAPLRPLGSAAPLSSRQDPEEVESRAVLTRHLQYMVSRDFAWIYLAILIICISEGDRLISDPKFPVVKVMYEVVSAYGTVGLSLGHPSTPASCSAVYSTVSKLAVIFVMILGRHRGLPDSLDPAVSVLGTTATRLAKFEEGSGRGGEEGSGAPAPPSPRGGPPSAAGAMASRPGWSRPELRQSFRRTILGSFKGLVAGPGGGAEPPPRRDDPAPRPGPTPPQSGPSVLERSLHAANQILPRLLKRRGSLLVRPAVPLASRNEPHGHFNFDEACRAARRSLDMAGPARPQQPGHEPQSPPMRAAPAPPLSPVPGSPELLGAASPPQEDRALRSPPSSGMQHAMRTLPRSGSSMNRGHAGRRASMEAFMLQELTHGHAGGHRGQLASPGTHLQLAASPGLSPPPFRVQRERLAANDTAPSRRQAPRLPRSSTMPNRRAAPAPATPPTFAPPGPSPATPPGASDGPPALELEAAVEPELPPRGARSERGLDTVDEGREGATPAPQPPAAAAGHESAQATGS